MSKKIALVAMLVLFLSASAFAVENQDPMARISGEKEFPDDHDWLTFWCGDWDIALPIEYRCTTTKWYYFLDQDVPCSTQKADYLYSIEENFRGPHPKLPLERSKSEYEIQCPEEWVEYVCLWVEDGKYSGGGQCDVGLDQGCDIERSDNILVDCSIGAVNILSPTIDDPALLLDTDSVNVLFNVSEPSVVSYLITISNASSGTIYSNSVPISGPGDYTETASWTDVLDGVYAIEATITDEAGQESSDTETGAVIIDSPDSPLCGSTASAYMVGTSAGEANALDLSKVCTDPEGDSITYSLIDPSDCFAGAENLVESVSISVEGMVSMGAVPTGRNETITDFSDTCIVKFRAVDEGGLETFSTFNVTVFQTGDIEIKIRYPSETDGGTDADLAEIGILVPENLEPGDEVCFDIVIENNKSIFETGKPLDLAFVLDASGSMGTEINSVKNTISNITDFVTLMCEMGEVPLADCFRLGIVVMEGSAEESCVTKFVGKKKKPVTTCTSGPIANWQMDLTSDTESIKDYVAGITASGAIEVWADYVINMIEDDVGKVMRYYGGWGDVDVMSWRAEAIKLILVLSDASSDGQSAVNRVHTSSEIAGYAVPAAVGPIIVSGLGMEVGCDSGCPLVCTDSPICDIVTGEMKDVADATGGVAYVYQKTEEDIQEKLMEAIVQTVSEDDVLMELKSGPPELVDLPIVLPATITVKRGTREEIKDVCITADGEDVFTFEASNPETAEELDEFDIDIVFGAVDPVIAVIGLPPGIINEGEEVLFTGSASTSDPEDPINQWEWDFDGDFVTDAFGETALHSFPDNGSYPITLTVTTQNSEIDTDQKNVTVENLAPEFYIETEQDVVLPGFEIWLAIEDIEDVDADLPPAANLMFTWDFGDGSPEENSQTVNHAWAEKGTYTVTAEVCDKDYGCKTRQKTIKVLSFDDVLVLADFETLKESVQTTVFEADDILEIEIVVANNYFDPVWGPAPVDVSWEVKILDAVTNEVLPFGPISGSVTIGPADEETIETSIYLASLDLEEGNYIVEASVTVETAGINEVYTANNLKLKTISVNFPIFVPVPEMPLLLLPLILLAVLILIKREQPKAE